MANRIHSKGPFNYEEHVAANATIMPGHLLQVNSSNQVLNHNVAGGRAERLFAQEDALQGRTISQGYANAAIVGCILPSLGSEVRAMLRDGQNVSIGDELVSNGDGTLVAALDMNSYDELQTVIGRAMEAKDLSGSAANANALIRIRITAG